MLNVHPIMYEGVALPESRALAMSFNGLEGAMARAVEVLLLLAERAALLRSWLSLCWRSNWPGPDCSKPVVKAEAEAES